MSKTMVPGSIVIDIYCRFRHTERLDCNDEFVTMKIQMTTDAGCARGVLAHQWFKSLEESRDYCKLVVQKTFSAVRKKSMLAKLEACDSPQALTNAMTGLTRYSFHQV
jgi:hypothetical protein